jgi:hypothetical protein
MLGTVESGLEHPVISGIDPETLPRRCISGQGWLRIDRESRAVGTHELVSQPNWIAAGGVTGDAVRFARGLPLATTEGIAAMHISVAPVR